MSPECAQPAIPIPTTLAGWGTRFLMKATSWGRFSSAVCLAVAVIGQFKTNPIDAAHLALWLAGAGGTFGLTKWLTPTQGGPQ